MDKLKIYGTLALSVSYFAQAATSFPLVRAGCVWLVLGFFFFIAADAFLDTAKAKGEGYYGEVLTIITPHLIAAAVVLAMVALGVYVGWH
jgi:hypothetical protein